MIHFTAWWAWLLLPLPWLISYLLPPVTHTQQEALRIPFFQRLRDINHAPVANSQGLPPLEKVIAWLIWGLLVCAAANPAFLGTPLPIQQEGRNIMLAIDTSGSMQIEDMDLHGQPASRMDMIKAIGGQFIDQRTGDRLGLILFGTQAYLQTPLTFDRHTVHTLLDDTSVGLAGQMTDIGDAMGLAIKRLMQYPAKSRILVLLTDGANNSGMVAPLDAANMAAKQDIKIYTIGIGAEQAAVQTFFGVQYVNPSADLDENTLKQIAAITGGEYFRAKDSQSLQNIYQQINKLQPVSADQRFFRPVKLLYPWPLSAALLLSILWVGRLARSWRFTF